MITACHIVEMIKDYGNIDTNTLKVKIILLEMDQFNRYEMVAT